MWFTRPGWKGACVNHAEAGIRWPLLWGIAGVLLCFWTPAAWPAEIKVLLCTGDYGMWAQDRVPLITNAVAKAAPGHARFESEQSFNFVKKLEAPGYAERFDVIVCGDIALGQMTTKAQEALVRFVNGGGGFIYVVWAKSTIPFHGPRAAEPMPLAAILPYKFPTTDPRKDVKSDAVAFRIDAPLFKGLDFSTAPLGAKDEAARKKLPPLALERTQGKGRVVALFGAFGASYKYLSYAKFEKEPGGWDQWPPLGTLWTRLLKHVGAGSPVRARSRAELDARVKVEPLTVQIQVDASKTIDQVRAANFSIVAMQQLYNEDGGAGEDLFLALNPRDWFDRRSQELFSNTKGKFPDKPAFFAKYNIKGIIMAENSYGSYGKWDDKTWQAQIDKSTQAAKKHPGVLTYFQPGNEPPLDEGYFRFHNRLAGAVLAGAPALKVIGPNTAFNMHGPNEKGMKAFIDVCGPKTDVLNWHIYACCPDSVRAEVLYWTKYAKGKMRSKGPVQVMFTESDAWNTRDSQFNYLMDRAYVFLPMKEILANFQYCMRPRHEGGTYFFGILQPEGEFSANYNGYWIWRNLRGRLVETKVTSRPQAGANHCRVLASRSDGQSVTVVVYYDTGYFDGTARARSDRAKASLTVKLPAGQYRLERSDADWKTRRTTAVGGTAHTSATVEVELLPCQAAAFTWTRIKEAVK